MDRDIVIIGATGQLGHDLCERLGPRAVGLTHREVELCERESLSQTLSPLRPRIVINTAAFNFVDDAETRAGEAFAVNALGVRELSLVCRDLDCVLVHFSTDYAFGLDGCRRDPYSEDDVSGPINIYGTSKLAGECFVRSLCPKHFVVRTCGLYGHHGSGGKGRNFVNTMLRLAREGRPVRVVADQICTPTATADLADATLRLIETDAFGLYHWTNGGQCSWHEFASEIFRLAGLTVDCTPITTAEFGSRALRPAFTVLEARRWQTLGLPTPRPWQDALREFLSSLPPR
ncbi:MAG: dTDP-4-dehydrorhamnose reductase [Planctomycetes bacterium]|nr:dTDP-4-dehydrorhamnose reductase [Planctomycetota bacterium]